MSPEFLAVFQRHANRDGAMTFARFMEFALYAPEVGYYRRERRRVGYAPGTDFFTASTSGPLFGELVAAACAGLLRAGGKAPGDFVFVEIGAENAEGILGGVVHPFRETRVVRWGQPLALSGRCVVFSNELFDAQPFRRFVFRDGSWRELGVALRDGSLSEVEIAPEATVGATVGKTVEGTVGKTVGETVGRTVGETVGRTVGETVGGTVGETVGASLLATGRESREQARSHSSTEGFSHSSSQGFSRRFSIDVLPQSAPEGYVIDAPMAAAVFAHDIAAQPWTGLFVACDYGKSWRELIEATPAGTARAYFQHTQSNDLLARPGEQDLTCHICWDWLSAALAAAGFAAPTLESQEAFLIHHAGEAIAAISAAEAARFSPRKLSLLQLLHPGQLGQKFQVLHAWRA